MNVSALFGANFAIYVLSENVCVRVCNDHFLASAVSLLSLASVTFRVLPSSRL